MKLFGTLNAVFEWHELEMDFFFVSFLSLNNLEAAAANAIVLFKFQWIPIVVGLNQWGLNQEVELKLTKDSMQKCKHLTLILSTSRGSEWKTRQRT